MILIGGSADPAFAQKKITTSISLPLLEITETVSVDLKAILKQGWKSGKLPEGVVIRVAADLGGSIDGKLDLKEAWEFSAGQVHKIEYRKASASSKAGYQRLKSLPFETKNLCEELIEGDAFEIEAGEGDEKSAQFVGTQCRLGFRRITVLIDGKVELELEESCLFAGYPKSLAKKFAVLYEQLAQHARDEFSKK